MLMLAAVFCFALLDAVGKHLAQTYPIPLLAWARYAVHMLAMAIVLGPSMRGRLLQTRRPLLQFARGLMLSATTVFYLAAFRLMPLAEATALIFLAPLIVSLAAGPLLGEKITVARWTGLLVGFLGVILIARPGADSSDINTAGVAFAIGGALSYSVYQIQTRLLAPSENNVAMQFFTAMTGTIVMSIALPWYWEGPKPGIAEIAMFCSLGALGGTGHFMLTRAFRFAPASVLAPFFYVQLAWATLLGWIVFAQVPDLQSLVGIAIIASSGLSIALSQPHTAAKPGT
jgi:drug/metabolite transporter (DMT)-like permease